MPRCTVTDLEKRFGQLHAVRGATLDVRRGEVLGLLGPNGAGKSTLLACMAGVLAPDGGTIHDRDGSALTSDDRRALCFFLPDGIRPWGAQGAGWLLRFAAGTFGTSTARRDDVLTVLRIAELGEQRIDTLSKGQRKRVLLAMALLVPHPVLLLDEPFDGLDLRLVREVIALLRREAAAGRSIVISLHVMPDAERVCDRVTLLDDGRTVATGSVEALRAQAGLPGAPLDEVFLALT